MQGAAQRSSAPAPRGTGCVARGAMQTTSARAPVPPTPGELNVCGDGCKANQRPRALSGVIRQIHFLPRLWHRGKTLGGNGVLGRCSGTGNRKGRQHARLPCATAPPPYSTLSSKLGTRAGYLPVLKRRILSRAASRRLIKPLCSSFLYSSGTAMMI
jgi:hypothetical protein